MGALAGSWVVGEAQTGDETMRSYDPTDESDREGAADLNAEPWMLDLVAANPDLSREGAL